MGGWTTKQFAPSIVAGLVGAVIVAASLTLTGNLSVGGSSTLGDSDSDVNISRGTLTNQTTVVDSNSAIKWQNDVQIWSAAARGADLADAWVLRDQTGGADAVVVTVGASGTFSTLNAINEDGWTTLTQAAQQVVTNAADTNSNTFTFSATVNTLYAIECDLFMTGEASANDAEFRFAVSAGSMTGRGTVVHPNAADTGTVTTINAAAAANTTQIPVGTFSSTNNPVFVHVDYSWIQNTSTGTLTLQFGNLVPAAGIDSTMEPNSRCRWRVIR